MNLEEVLKRKKAMDDICNVERVILISDGSTKEYKSANAFARKKMLDRKYNIGRFNRIYFPRRLQTLYLENYAESA